MTGRISRSRRDHPGWGGVVDGFTLSLAIAPFALTVGAGIADADVDRFAAWCGSFLIFGGAAQLAAIEILDAGGGSISAAAAAVAINLRFVAYGPALAHWFRTESRSTRALLALPVVDQTYLACANRFARGDLDSTGRRYYYLGVAGIPAAVWVSVQGLGVHMSGSLPAAEVVSIAPALLFAGLLVATVGGIRQLVTAATAGAVVLAAAPLLGSLSLGVGIVAAAFALGDSP